MLFTQVEFGVLLLAVLGSFALLRGHGPRKIVLLIASYYFYAYWDWRFLSLIIGSTVLDFFVARAIERSDRPRRRKRLLAVSVVANLGLLATFKYLGFFAASFEAAFGPALAAVGWTPNLDLLTGIVLPVGISFYTFQTLSYTIDVYRGGLRSCERFTDFALFVAFFPQLVAGPIVRASHLLPQFVGSRPLSWDRAVRGFSQFTVGLFKKVFIADRIAAFVDAIFANAELYDGAAIWLAVGCYSVQIYCDFSGYSDMAIGTARLLGYDFEENFEHPYISRSITEFWRRWHISLSSWLRDYLYIPLGGNRRGPVRTYINLMLTMLLGGLWHGAAWTFVVWGLIHGGALALERLMRPRLAGVVAALPRALAAALGWGWTLLIVMVAWVFFRAPDFGTAAVVIERMFTAPGGTAWLPPFSLFAVALIGAAQALAVSRWARLRAFAPDRLHTPVVLFSMWWLVLVFPVRDFAPFIYFQF